MTVVDPFHAFMHKPCNTANILTLYQISHCIKLNRGRPAKRNLMSLVLSHENNKRSSSSSGATESSPNSLFHLRQDLSLRGNPSCLSSSYDHIKTKSGHTEDELFRQLQCTPTCPKVTMHACYFPHKRRSKMSNICSLHVALCNSACLMSMAQLTVLPLLVGAQQWSLVVSLVLFVLLHAIPLFSTCVPLFPFCMPLVFCLIFLYLWFPCSYVLYCFLPCSSVHSDSMLL
jgi:hypothetical protein